METGEKGIMFASISSYFFIAKREEFFYEKIIVLLAFKLYFRKIRFCRNAPTGYGSFSKKFDKMTLKLIECARWKNTASPLGRIDDKTGYSRRFVDAREFA
ncbi:hypothetical protein HZA38_03250 [Candidatus Peregrinibacteria bacterium]|nr:hypothetical protein [Candidatus Peregrinibacteria bacterium]